MLPTGFRGAAVDADLAKGSRLDLALIVSDAAGMAGAMFTRNRVVAAPVALSREHLRQTSGISFHGCEDCISTMDLDLHGKTSKK